MGISGLLPLLKESQEDVHISKYKGKVVGVDAYVWLHRGAYGCAEALALGRPTQSYVKFAMSRVEMLKHNGVQPYIVFDGDHLPAKAHTERERAERRQHHTTRARELVARGKRKEAREHYVRCIDVTPEMAYQFIKALKKAGVPYIVAAYEADAQLAYLERQGVIDAIVTEDSDLLVFGCKRVLYKLDAEGYCKEVDHAKRSLCTTLNFGLFTDDAFRQMAILSGCDYLASIPGLGLKKSYLLLKKHQTVARVLAAVRLDGMRVPEDYPEAFSRAEKTFVYQRVFARQNDGSVRLVTLTEPPTPELVSDSDDFIGPIMSQDIATAIADGDLNPITREPIIDLAPSPSPEAGAREEYAKGIQTRAPNTFYRSRSQSKASPVQKEAGQRGLESFFKRSSSSASSSTPRPPMLDNTNQASRSTSHIEVLRIEDGMAGVQGSTSAGRSRYFARHEKGDNANANHDIEIAAALTPKNDRSRSAAQLASFSPQTRAHRSPSHLSSDGGLISSPASAVKSVRRNDILSTSPGTVEDAIASSPCTSPTQETLAVTASTTSDCLLRKRKRGSPFDEDDDTRDDDGTPLATKNLFEQWRFDASSTSALMTPTQSKAHAPFPRRLSNTVDMLPQRCKSRPASTTPIQHIENDFALDQDEKENHVDVSRSAHKARLSHVLATPTENKFAAFAFSRKTASARKATPNRSPPKPAALARSASSRRLNLS